MPSFIARRAARFAPALLAAAPAALRAQLPNPLGAPGPRAGVMAGLSSATLGGSDAQLEGSDLQAGVSKKRRNGFVAGGYLTFPIVPGLPLSLRPELLYAQKGLRVTGPGSVASVNGVTLTQGTFTATTKLDYLELPVLLQLDVPTTAGLRPSLYAGPSVAYLLRCRLETDEGGGTTTSEDCNSGGNGPRKFDAGGVAGGQLNFALAGRAVGVGARYTFGLTKLDKNADVKNRAFAVYGAIEIGR